MKAIAIGTATLLLIAGAASAAGPSCNTQAAEKKLAGAAHKSFMTKCASEAKAACGVNAKSQNLAGAAKSSYEKKCAADAVGKKG